MIEKILERFYNIDPQEMMTEEQRNVLNYCTEIVREVAKEYAEIARESREDFMEIVYSELEEDADNNRANRIIDAFDNYAPYQKGE